MFKRIIVFAVLGSFCLLMSGCGPLLGAALAGAASYGIYQATRK